MKITKTLTTTLNKILDKGGLKDFTPDHVVYIVQKLYDLKYAEAFFIGMGWPEGYHYCEQESYIRNTFYFSYKANHNNEARALWFAAIRLLRKGGD